MANYIAEYYGLANKSITQGLNPSASTEKLEEIKKEIKKISDQLAAKQQEMTEEYEKVYSKDYVPANIKYSATYSGRSGNFSYDLQTGLRIDDRNDPSYVDIRLGGVAGSFAIVVGYNYKLASIVINEMSYSLKQDKTKIITRITGHGLLSFLTSEYAYILPGYDQVFESNCSYLSADLKNSLYRVSPNEFIRQMYGVEYKGSMNFESLRESAIKNKAFEVILKTSPDERIMNTLMRNNFPQSKPIHKLLGISKENYEKAIEKNLLHEVVDISTMCISQNVDFLMPSSYIEFAEFCKLFKEDMDFYEVEVGRYENRAVYEWLIENYKDVIRKHYTFKKFCIAAKDIVINQGFSSLREYETTLTDYLRICEEDNEAPHTETNQLKVIHDVAYRNHKVKVSEQDEKRFNAQYEGFEPYKGFGYTITCPTTTKDLKLEGSRLCHCVGTYIKRVIDGECKILFLRKDPEESLITIEVRDNMIAQVHGLYNRMPNEEESKVIRAFANDRKLALRY